MNLRKSLLSGLGSAFVLGVFVWFVGGVALAQCPDDDEFTTDFRLEDCRFKANDGNPFIILEPGFQLILEGEDEGEELLLQITVLDEIEFIDLTAQGLGSCPQTALSFHAELVRAQLSVDENFKLLFGISFGHPDPSAAANQCQTERAAAADGVRFHQ